MKINPISRETVKCEESNKIRQKNDFSEIFRSSQTEKNSPLQTKTPTQTSTITRPGPETGNDRTLISLGTVTRRNPNVSSLLVKHPLLKKDCWHILHSQVNSDKPFTRIRAGTDIFMDPETKEILWGKMLPASISSKAVVKTVIPETQNDHKFLPAEKPFSERLVGAVKPFFGRPYGEMNCYELLVKGLTNLGVRYQGSGGLGRKLMVMAKEQGLPTNAYFNGEGLIAASGSSVYSKTLFKVRSPEQQANQVLQEIKPYLEKGQILSFSIHSRGHTGIVSRAQNTWTLINSGRMNHSLESTNLPKGVGEESLEAEIRDWFKLARNRNESLRITLGRLNEKQLVTYYDEPPAKPKKV